MVDTQRQSLFLRHNYMDGWQGSKVGMDQPHLAVLEVWTLNVDVGTGSRN